MFISYGKSFAFNDNLDAVTHIDKTTINRKTVYIFTMKSGISFETEEDDLTPRGKRLIEAAFETGGKLVE